MIYSLSLKIDVVVSVWRLASAIPVFKRGYKNEPSNYRPVFLTSVPGKLTERI
jgi:hypothetical protein